MSPSGVRSLIRIAGAAAIAALLSGCFKAAHHTNGSVSVVPAPGGTIVFATDREPFSLDPARGGDQPQSDIARAYLDSLVKQEADGSFTPWLAESWDISKDETTYTFHLRKDVKFTDGTPFNAAAVKANFEHWLDPVSVNSESSISLKHLKSMTTPDAFTFVVNLGMPYADFLSVLASAFSGMESPAGIARGPQKNDLRPVGTGPFLIKTWDKQSQVVLVRNDQYRWAPKTAAHQGPAYAKELDWKFIPEGTTRFAALRSGELDVLETVPPTNFAQIASDHSLTIIDGVRAGVPVQLDFNTKRPPFDDINVRKAFRYSTDVAAALRSIYFGAYRGFGGSLASSTIFFDPSFEKTYTPDLSKANKLLDQAGWSQRDGDGYRVKDGHRLTVNAVLGMGATAQEYFLLDQIAGSAKKAGFEVKYEKLDDSQAQARRAKWDYDLTKDYWGGPNTAAALFFLYDSSMSADLGQGYHPNGSGYGNAQLDRDMEDAIKVNAAPKRQQLYSDAQRIISEESVNLPLYLQPLQYAYRNDRIRGVSTDPRTHQISFYDAWLMSQ